MFRSSTAIPGASEEDGAAVEEDHGGEHRRDEAVPRELGRGEPEPVLDHLAVDDNRDREDQGDPEAAPVHIRMPGMAQVLVSPTVTSVAGRAGEVAPVLAGHSPRAVS